MATSSNSGWLRAFGVAAVFTAAIPALAQDTDKKKQPAPPQRPAPSGSGQTLLDRKDTKITTKPAAPSQASKPLGSESATGRKLRVDPVMPMPDSNIRDRYGRLLTGGGGMSDDGSDVQIGPIIDPSGRLTTEQTRARLIEAVRDGDPPHTNQELRDFVFPKPVDVDAIRKEYHEEGYMEGTLRNGNIVFIKSSNWCEFYEAMDRLNGQQSQYPPDDLYRSGDSWCDPHRIHSSDPIMDPYAGSVDRFVAGGADKDHASSGESGSRRDLSMLEKADSDLREGSLSLAIEEYQAYLVRNSEDSAAARMLGVALIMSKKVPEGMAKIAAAYESDPTLASRPIDPGMLHDGEAAIKDILPAAVALAHRTKSAGSWIGVAALMQAQGRNEAAARMVARAKDSGASEKLVAEFTMALEPAKGRQEAAK